MAAAEDVAYVQPQAQVAGAALAAFVEGVGGLGQRLGGEAGAVVGDGDGQDSFLGPERERDARFRVARGVGEYVVADLHDGLGVYVQLGGEVIGDHTDGLARADYPGRVAQRAGEAQRVHPVAVDLRVLQALQPGHGVHVVFQPGYVAAHDADLLFGLLAGYPALGQALGEHVRVALEHGQRRAQVVRKGGVETAALLHLGPHLAAVCVQRGAHGLKGLRQAAQLVAALGLEREAQVIGRNARAGAVEGHYGPAQAPAPEQHGAEYECAEVADGYGGGLQDCADPVPEPVGIAVLRRDEKRIGVRVLADSYFYGAFAVGYLAALHYFVVGTVDNVHLAAGGADVQAVIAALGDGYLLRLVLVFEMQADAVFVQQVYDDGAGEGGQYGGDQHVPDKGGAQGHILPAASRRGATLSCPCPGKTKTVHHFAHL